MSEPRQGRARDAAARPQERLPRSQQDLQPLQRHRLWRRCTSQSGDRAQCGETSPPPRIGGCATRPRAGKAPSPPLASRAADRPRNLLRLPVRMFYSLLARQRLGEAARSRVDRCSPIERPRLRASRHSHAIQGPPRRSASVSTSGTTARYPRREESIGCTEWTSVVAPPTSTTTGARSRGSL